MLAVLFGWVRKSDGMRRFREIYAEIPRKNAKSTLAAIIGLNMLVADDEGGAEVYSGATSEKQAWEVFRPAKLMAEKSPGFASRFGVNVAAKSIHVIPTASRFEPVVGNPGDGSSPHCAIVDEYHEHKTSDLYDTMVTGNGSQGAANAGCDHHRGHGSARGLAMPSTTRPSRCSAARCKTTSCSR